VKDDSLRFSTNFLRCSYIVMQVFVNDIDFAKEQMSSNTLRTGFCLENKNKR
jgi:hypothetical protein